MFKEGMPWDIILIVMLIGFIWGILRARKK
jgi:hypothetical protein